MLDVCPFVRPSVRLSVCPSHAGIVSKRLNIVMLSSPHDSPFILVLCISRSSRNSDGVTRCGAAKQRCGMKMLQFSTNTRHRYIAISQKWLKIDGYNAARRLTSIECSFHPCNTYRDNPGRIHGRPKCALDSREVAK